MSLPTRPQTPPSSLPFPVIHTSSHTHLCPISVITTQLINQSASACSRRFFSVTQTNLLPPLPVWCSQFFLWTLTASWGCLLPCCLLPWISSLCLPLLGSSALSLSTLSFYFVKTFELPFESSYKNISVIIHVIFKLLLTWQNTCQKRNKKQNKNLTK